MTLVTRGWRFLNYNITQFNELISKKLSILGVYFLIPCRCSFCLRFCDVLDLFSHGSCICFLPILTSQLRFGC